jgi:thiol-disulfide isomerase/thioredoxin
MTGTINVGRFAIPCMLLVLAAAMLASVAVAKWAQRGGSRDIEPVLWKALIAGAVAARLAFVIRYFAAYRMAPWSVVDIRDGGFIAPAGIVVALAVLAAFGARRRDARKPLLWAGLAGAIVSVIGIAASLMFYTGPTVMPALTLTRLDGGDVQMQALKGKPLVVNLWASWCPPCRHEMPVLRDAQAQQPDVRFVFVNQGEPADVIRKYLGEQHLALDNVLVDTGLQLGMQTGSRALPTTLFFDANGKLVDRRVGELSAATLAQRLDALRDRQGMR